MADSQYEFPDLGLRIFSLRFLTAQFLEYIWPSSFFCSLLSASFLSESDKAECWDILSSSTHLHNPGNILPLCSQSSGDLAPGSAVAMARWPSAYSGSPIRQDAHTDGPILKSTALSRKISVWAAHRGCFLLGYHRNLIQAVPQDWLKSPCHLTFKLVPLLLEVLPSFCNNDVLFRISFSGWCLDIFCTLIVSHNDKATHDYSLTVTETKAR